MVMGDKSQGVGLKRGTKGRTYKTKEERRTQERVTPHKKTGSSLTGIIVEEEKRSECARPDKIKKRG